jgi:transposase-like protein
VGSVPELISRVPDSVVEEMKAWRQRPLDRVYPVVFIDALVMRIRQGQVANRPVYVVVGISLDGERDVLGMWAGGEGAKQRAGYLVRASPFLDYDHEVREVLYTTNTIESLNALILA